MLRWGTALWGAFREVSPAPSKDVQMLGCCCFILAWFSLCQVASSCPALPALCRRSQGTAGGLSSAVSVPRL